MKTICKILLSLCIIAGLISYAYWVKTKLTCEKTCGTSVKHVSSGAEIVVFNEKGHEYIIAGWGYGCSIIHSESCPCKNKIK